MCAVLKLLILQPVNVFHVKSLPFVGRVLCFLYCCRFAHAETLIPLVTALGLYKDKEPLLATNYEGVIACYHCV